MFFELRLAELIFFLSALSCPSQGAVSKVVGHGPGHSEGSDDFLAHEWRSHMARRRNEFEDQGHGEEMAARVPFFASISLVL